MFIRCIHDPNIRLALLPTGTAAGPGVIQVSLTPYVTGTAKHSETLFFGVETVNRTGDWERSFLDRFDPALEQQLEGMIRQNCNAILGPVNSLIATHFPVKANIEVSQIDFPRGGMYVPKKVVTVYDGPMPIEVEISGVAEFDSPADIYGRSHAILEIWKPNSSGDREHRGSYALFLAAYMLPPGEERRPVPLWHESIPSSTVLASLISEGLRDPSVESYYQPVISADEFPHVSSVVIHYTRAL